MTTNWDAVASSINKTQSTTGGEALFYVGIVLNHLAVAVQNLEEGVGEDRDQLLAFATWLADGEHFEGREAELVDKYISEQRVVGEEQQ